MTHFVIDFQHGPICGAIYYDSAANVPELVDCPHCLALMDEARLQALGEALFEAFNDPEV